MHFLRVFHHFSFSHVFCRTTRTFFLHNNTKKEEDSEKRRFAFWHCWVFAKKNLHSFIVTLVFTKKRKSVPKQIKDIFSEKTSKTFLTALPSLCGFDRLHIHPLRTLHRGRTRSFHSFARYLFPLCARQHPRACLHKVC